MNTTIVYYVEITTYANCFFSDYFYNFEDAACYWDNGRDVRMGKFVALYVDTYHVVKDRRTIAAK